jgi:isopenicillin-N epimerase
LRPLVVSWGRQALDPGPSPFQDYFSWTGTDDSSAYLSVPAAIAFQAEHDWPRVPAACHELAAEALAGIAALTGLPPICPETATWWAQMCAAPLPTVGPSSEELKRRLWDDYAVEVPIVEWQGQRFVRISIQAYNSARDVDRLLEGLTHLL